MERAWEAAKAGALAGHVVLAGAVAFERLARPPLRCFAAFARSFYLINEAGELLCCGEADLEPGPLMFLCAPWPEPPRPGEVLRLADVSVQQQEGGVLAWEAGRLCLQKPRFWEPPPQPLAPVAPAHSAARLRALLEHRPPDTPFAPLFALALPSEAKGAGGARRAGEEDGCLAAAVPQHAGTPDSASSALLAAGEKGLRGLQAWLRAPDPCSLSEPDPSSLLGLGPGLTPSGDDILGGTLLGLRLLGRQARADALVAAVRAALDQTHAISAAHLELAGQGLGADALHRFFAALREPWPEDAVKHDPAPYAPKLDQLAARLDRIGHSSGWDMVLGLALALGSAEESFGAGASD